MEIYIIERGNGYPQAGEVVGFFDATGRLQAFRIGETSGPIQTDCPRLGDYCWFEVEEVDDADADTETYEVRIDMD